MPALGPSLFQRICLVAFAAADLGEGDPPPGPPPPPYLGLKRRIDRGKRSLPGN